MHRGPALGLESKTVRVVPYDARWPQLYAAEAERITRALSDRGLSLELEHTGSTAVPGLAAKPIIDILAGRDAEASRPALIAALESAGYMYRGESGIPGRDFFRRGDPRSYHVHLVERGCQFWNDHRAFRDYLRTHPDAAEAYAALKTELARRFPKDRERYIDEKTDFVLGILERSRSG